MTRNRTVSNILFQGGPGQVLGANTSNNASWDVRWLPPPQGRLSSNSTQPVDPAAANTAYTTIYYLPYYGGCQVPVWDGTRWTIQVVPDAGISLVLESNISNTGFHQSGKNFDIFAIVNSGVLTLATGPAWTSDTVRANVLANTAGILSNSNTQTMRIGAGTTNSLSVTANFGTFLGSMRGTPANGQTQMYIGGALSGCKAAVFGIANYYNRVGFKPAVTDNGGSYTYTGTSIRAWRNSANARFSWISTAADEPIFASAYANFGSNNVSATSSGYILDSTTTFTNFNTAGFTSVTNGQAPTPVSGFVPPQIGWHFIAGCDGGVTAGSQLSVSPTDVSDVTDSVLSGIIRL